MQTKKSAHVFLSRSSVNPVEFRLRLSHLEMVSLGQTDVPQSQQPETGGIYLVSRSLKKNQEYFFPSQLFCEF